MRKKFEVEFSVDDMKAFKIAERLFDQFRNKKGFFEKYSMPEYILPRNLREGSREHALFLTYVISIDYMTDAEKLWKKSRGAYELHPERFTPEKLLKVSPRTVETFVRKLGARFGSTAAGIWVKISKVLVDKYGGDPRQITNQPLDVAEIKKKLNDLPSLRGPKLSNFYIRAMGETGLFKVKNLNELDIPVDKQVARFTMHTGVLKLLSDKFVGCAQEKPMRDYIEEAWRNAARKLGTAPWKLDEPIWTIGSKLCSGRKCGQCPVENLCDRTAGIVFKENTVIWRRDARRREALSMRVRTDMPENEKKADDSGEYVVFEDLADATGPKVHSVTCRYYRRWLERPTTTTKWYGPYESEKKAWETCKGLSSKSKHKPSWHKCVKRT